MLAFLAPLESLANPPINAFLKANTPGTAQLNVVLSFALHAKKLNRCSFLPLDLLLLPLLLLPTFPLRLPKPMEPC